MGRDYNSQLSMSTFSSRSSAGGGGPAAHESSNSSNSKQSSAVKFSSESHRLLHVDYGNQQIPRQMLIWTSTLYLTIALLLWSAPSVRAQSTSKPIDQGAPLKSLASAWGVSFSDWELTTDPCTGLWSGVTCDGNGRVVKLNLTGAGLKGPISSAIGQLVHLESLILENNAIRDPIPVEIGKLVRLTDLNLINNNLTSIPPDALLKCNLTNLLMASNRIRGQLPAWIGQIVTLRNLDFNSNELWGGLPPEYGNLRNLETLQLWENELSGFLPSEWKALVKVNFFGMGHLYTTGPIPDWLFELPELRVAHFMRSQFIGSLPNLSRLMHNGIANFTDWDFSCNFLDGDYPTQYYSVLPVPNASVSYYSNCFKNETDGSATISSPANATENTPTNCSRTYNCPGFFEAQLRNLGQCAPCPPSQFITDQTRCICGYELSGSGLQSKLPVGAVVGGVVGGMAVTIFAAYVIFLIFRKKTPNKYPQFGRKYEGINDPWIVPEELHRFSLPELERATDNFSDRFYIGEGGFGKVYKGILDSGKAVAIKCASNESAQGQLEFRNELTLLSRLHHRHLCALEGFCDDDGLQVLVYEFMENGDLHDNLFGRDTTLNAAQRREVAVGIARGLDYLHSFANPPVIHRDVKPSNVLLDQYNVAKLADFGISKISPELNTHVSTRPLGTMGYMDPDYFRTNQLTVASDVYAFGIVLLELTTGQRVFDITRLDAVNLNDWVRPRFKKGGVQAIIDKSLGENYDERLFTALTEVGLMCSRSDRMDRPTMKEVLNMLEPFAVSKSFKKVQCEQPPRWSAEYYKDKSLVESEPKSKSVPVTSGVTKQNLVMQSGDPSSCSSFDSGRPSTAPYGSFTALHPR